MLAQQRRRANTGQLQQLGRLQGAAGQYHLAIGPGYVHRAVLHPLHAHGSAMGLQHPSGMGTGKHHQVGALSHWR